jgi:hypothetical protein
MSQAARRGYAATPVTTYFRQFYNSLSKKIAENLKKGQGFEKLEDFLIAFLTAIFE